MGALISIELLICGHTGQWGQFAVVGPGMVDFPATVALLRRHDRVAVFDTGCSTRSHELLDHWPEAGYRRLLPTHLQPDDALATQQRQLRDFDPTILAAPSAALDLYERAVRRGELRLRPRTIYSVADVLDDRLRDRLHDTFRVTIGQIYQATEGFLGISCTQGTLHINDDLVHVEREPVGDDPRRFIPVITDLTRTSQAIIRYRMGDVLVAAEEPCPCGSPLTPITAIEGRVDNILWLPNARGTPTILFADFIRNAILGAPGSTTSGWYTVVG